MTSHNGRTISTTETRNNFAAEIPIDDGGESVEDMLANVDQFIDSVYRDLRICPPPRCSIGNGAFRAGRTLDDVSSNSSSANTSEETSLPDATIRDEITPAVSPVARRNMDAEIERINRICDNVDQNLRSIGLYMNNDASSSTDLSNTSMVNSPLSSEPIIISAFIEKVNSNKQNSQRRGTLPLENSLSPQIIDLSNSQTEASGISIQPDRLSNGGDDDVVIVSADFPPVVDLCTPNEDKIRPSSILRSQLNRRRLNRYDNMDDDDPVCGRPPTARQRRTEFFVQSESNKSSDSVKPTTNHADRPPFMCPVCMESCLQSQPTSTLCGHVFCNKCIERAIALTHKCPMCNKKISKKQTFRIYL